MNIDDWTSQIWPWLQSVANRVRREIPDQPSAEAVATAFSDLAAVASLLGTETCIHLFTQSTWLYRQQGWTQNRIEKLKQIVDGVGTDAKDETADSLAGFILSISNEIPTIPALSQLIAELLLRLPTTSNVLAARRAFTSAPERSELDAESSRETVNSAPPSSQEGATPAATASTDRDRERISGNSLTDEDAS